ncbi:MAG: MFS transporter [Acetobacteraceae bacterium]|nr:MFS transporter [Acetobacteraceae bacterium]
MIAFWIACLGLAVIGLPEGSLGVAWPALRISLGLPEAAFGLILICMATGTFCAGLVVGRLLETRGPRRVLTGAAILAACALCVIAVSPVTLVLCVGALLLGLGLGTIDAGVNAAAALSFEARRINWMHGCYGLGAMAGPVAMTGIIVQAGLTWRVGYLCLAVVLACASMLLVQCRATAIAANHAAGRLGGAWNAARHPLVHLQIVLFFVYTGVEVMLGQWSYSILTAARGVPDGVAGLCAGAYWGGIAVGRFVLGTAADRLGADRLLRYSTIAIVVGTFAFALAPGLWGALGLVITGLALAPVFPTLMARAPERLGPSVALHAIGFKVSAAMVGGAAFPAIGGLLADAAGLDTIGWCGAGGSVVVLVLHEAVLAASPQRRATVQSP